jgi:hypothetical protein
MIEHATVMNLQSTTLFAFIFVIFGVLVGSTSYPSVLDAKALKEKRRISGAARAAAVPLSPRPR